MKAHEPRTSAYCLKRSIWSIVALSFFITLFKIHPAHPQVQPQPSTGVTLDDLQGATIYLEITFKSRGRYAGSEFTGGSHKQIIVTFGPGTAIQWRTRHANWTDTANGRKNNPIMLGGGKGAIGVPAKGSGGADFLYLFQDSTLTVLLVYQIGGGKLRVKFERSPTVGLFCSVEVAAAKEVGTRVLTKERAAVGGTAEILSTRVVGTPTCRIRNEH
jgi:hypothetical protein